MSYPVVEGRFPYPPLWRPLQLLVRRLSLGPGASVWPSHCTITTGWMDKYPSYLVVTVRVLCPGSKAGPLDLHSYMWCRRGGYGWDGRRGWRRWAWLETGPAGLNFRILSPPGKKRDWRNDITKEKHGYWYVVRLYSTKSWRIIQSSNFWFVQTEIVFILLISSALNWVILYDL